ncbi:AAA family ATPase [Gilvimarinus sp. F26214L]|uniref:AAA family ATPase n=1 Tax=Gilvimarinus sp. DZF01 TaxID=3461371 RepID=UPI0040460DD1
MYLKRLTVQQLRQFREPFELSDLTPGINLIHGPNESGKSTLVRAIRAAFFERHRSGTVDDLRPWRDSAAAPTVELQFEAAGKEWRLTKSFLQRKRCDLQIGSERHSGDEAEAKLTELLGYEQPQRGASQDKHWGIPGLLWVEQGSGQDLQQSVEFAGDHLKSALNSLLGEVASTGGDGIIQAVSAQRDELLTGTGRPRGEYDQVGKQRLELEEQLSALQDRIATYRTEVDRLGELRRQHQQDEDSKPWHALWKQHSEAEERFRQVQQRQQEQQREQQALEGSRQTLALLEQRRHELADQAGRLQQRERDLANARRAHEELGEQSPILEQSRERAQSAYSDAEQNVRQARAQSERTKLEQDVRRLKTRLEELAASIAKVREFQGELDAARAQARSNPMDENTLKALRKTCRELEETSIRLQVVATRLRYELDDGKSLTLNGETLQGAGEHQLLEESELLVPGIGKLQIAPGGEDVGKLRRQLERLEQEQAQQLNRLNATSLEQAEQRAQVHAKSLESVRRLEALLESAAPKGLDALRSEEGELRQQLDDCHSELDALPKPEGPATPLREAEAARQTAELALDNAEGALQEHQTQLAMARQREENASREWQALRDEMNTPEREAATEKLEQQIRLTREQQAQLESSLRQRQAKIDEAQPDFLQQDMERLSASARQAETEHQARAVELQGLQSRLEVQGAEGLEEKHNELAAELEHVCRRFEELDRRARALDLLLNLLREKRQALTRRLQAPLQNHLDRYLALLFPKARLDVDESLQPGSFERDGELGHLEELSFGAREQLALVSRLAYADLLKEAGRPTLIILDDSLVHSDSGRLDQMKRILFDAAQRHQILLFTCHPDNWRDLGVAPRDLRALKSQPV